MSVHEFKTTVAAYDACQTRPELEAPGAILHIPLEGVVGMSWTWPIAITRAAGELHQLGGPEIPPEFSARACREAATFAHAQGYELARQFAPFIIREGVG